MSLTALIHER